jgi:PAS domain S-box-containing protein
VRRHLHSFTGRMVLGLLVVQFALTPLLFYGILHFIERGLQEQFVDQVRSKTRLYATLMEDAIVTGDAPEQVEVLNEALINEDMVQADLVLPGGYIVKPGADVWYLDSGFREDFDFGENDDRVYNIAVSLNRRRDGEYLGSLRLSFDERATHARIASAYRYGVLVAVGYAVFSMLLAVALGRRLTRPVKHLQEMAKIIAGGGEAANLEVDTDIREIGELAHDLDLMRQNLVDRNLAVEDREKRLFAILDNAGEGVITIGEDGVIESFNKAAESIFGLTTGDAQGRKISELIADLPPPEQLVVPLNGDDSDLSGSLPSGRRMEAIHQAGQRLPVLVTASHIHRAGEHVYILIVRDLTAEEEREKRLLTFWQVMQQSPVGIVITDNKGLIEYVNPHFCQVTGYTPEEVDRKNPRFLRTEHTSRDTYRDLWSTITSGFVWRGVFQNRKKNGELFWESDTICPVRDASGQIAHYIALKEDITEHREKDRMLTQAMKMDVVGRMTSGIAHDFNNLLTIILGNLQFLESELEDDDPNDFRELVSDAASAALDGSNLIKQLLIFTRREEPNVQPTRVSQFIGDLLPLLERTVPPNVQIRTEIAEDAGTVLVDANRLESAVLNLVINARDAMPGGGQILISATRGRLESAKQVEGGLISEGDYSFLEIADNGSGMTEEVRQKALEPFFTTKPGTSGTGLGLSMVNELVTQGEGGIRIESAPGKGTQVTLILPHYEGPAGARSARSGLPRRAVRAGLANGTETILLVEDREPVRLFARRTLDRLGYRVIEAGSAAEALQQLAQEPGIDLLFSDIVMPGELDGRGLARRAVELKPGLRVLLTTGMEMRAERDDHVELPLLRKPYSAEQLASAIRQVIETGRLVT